jgi:transposase
MEAKKMAEFTGLDRGSVNNIFNKIRERLAELCEAESPFENSEVELDESYFGARRVRGIRGRSARGKSPYSACSSGAIRCTHRSLKAARCKS